MQVGCAMPLSLGGAALLWTDFEVVGGGDRGNGGMFKSHFGCVSQRRLDHCTWEDSDLYAQQFQEPMYTTVEESRHRLTFPVYYLGRNDSAFSVVKL